MKIFFPISIFFLLTLTVFGQSAIIQNGDTLNRIDKNGHRQGIWTFSDIKTSMKIQIRITDDTPSDTIFYYLNNELKFKYIKSTPSKVSYCVNGKIITCDNYFDNDNSIYCLGDTVLKKTIKSFTMFEIFPSFYGGESAMFDYLKKRMLEKPGNEKGKVIVTFTLDKTGSTTDVKIHSSENSKLDEFCMEIIKEMPRWQPGYQGGAIVTVSLNLPLKFN